TEIAELCDSLQPLAASRKLFLKFDASAALVVDGDAVKVRRIAQNLILNALKYTEQGGVVVSCADVAGETARWALTVGDTGVGLDAARVAPLAQALSSVTKEAHAVARESAKGAAATELSTVPTMPSASTLAERAASERPSEGVGLSIVKRLCELLDASMELETNPGTGTTFRIIFPRYYSA
ncbi:MAG TPA: HAMP domain-containing sensor histidine kinase, partial [Steroidobacteraceae bacterium]